MRIGIIGLGRMGRGMAKCLLNAGHDLTVWNRDRGKAEELATLGAAVATTPREAAEAGVVITMLADDTALEAVCYGADGILAARDGVTHVSCSTVSVALTRRLTGDHADTNQAFVSAPVFGGPDAAAAGQLIFMTGCSPELYARCGSLFDIMGQKALSVGEDPAMAAAAKLAANFSLAAVIDTMPEAFAIAASGGVSPGALLKLFEDVNFGTRLGNIHERLISKT